MMAPAAAPAPEPAPFFAPSAAAAAAGPSAPSSSTMGENVLFNYPSFFSCFGQELFNWVGRSKKSQAEKILKSFDASAAEAQSMMRKAHDLTRSADELMGKAHHECYVGIKKLLDDARAQKFATNLKRMKKGKKGCLSGPKRLRSECGEASASGHAEGEQRPSSTNPEVDVLMQDRQEVHDDLPSTLVHDDFVPHDDLPSTLVHDGSTAQQEEHSQPQSKADLHVTSFFNKFLM